MMLLACSGKKNLSGKPTSNNSLYQKWQLVEVENTDPQEAPSQPSIDYKSKKLFVTFSKNGQMSFNLDANSCSGTFKEEANQKLIFNSTDFLCTKICCDTIKLNYAAVKRYQIDKNRLMLYSDKQVFRFELAE